MFRSDPDLGNVERLEFRARDAGRCRRYSTVCSLRDTERLVPSLSHVHGTTLAATATVTASGSLLRSQSHGFKSLLEVSDDVLYVFRADGETEEVWSHAGGGLLRFSQLLVCRTVRVNDQ